MDGVPTACSCPYHSSGKQHADEMVKCFHALESRWGRMINFLVTDKNKILDVRRLSSFLFWLDSGGSLIIFVSSSTTLLLGNIFPQEKRERKKRNYSENQKEKKERF